MWGINIPNGWGWDIVNFVWWIGIGHAGTLISAILFLLEPIVAQRYQPLRRSHDLLRRDVRRRVPVLPTSAESGSRTGCSPFPTTMSRWPNSRSPLIWDVFAVTTYLTVSVVSGLSVSCPIWPRCATAPRARRSRRPYGVFALGWRGSARHWRNYEKAYLILAGVSTPLVLSVHSIVSFDFAASVIPGWHTTIFPPYFVAGAVFSGFACVMTLLLIARWTLNLQNLITMKHLENMNKIILVTGSMVGYAYAWSSSSPGMAGTLRDVYFRQPRAGTLLVGVLVHGHLQRARPAALLVQEDAHQHPGDVRDLDRHQHRHVVRALRHHRHLAAPRLPPRSSCYFHPTWVDMCTFAGTIGLFLTLFLLFARFLPMIAMSEVKGVFGHSKSTCSKTRRSSRNERRSH